MLRLPASAFEADARGLVNTLMALRFLWVATAVCTIGAIASMLQAFEISPAARAVLVGAQLVLAALCIVATRLVHRLPPRWLVLAAAWIAVVVITLAAVSLQHGAHSLDLGFLPLVVCVVAVLVGTQPAFVMVLCAMAIVVALAVAEARGWVAGAASLSATPLSHPLVTHGLLLLAGFTVGAIMLRLSNASYRSAHERETRFRRLLAIAAQHYIELDAEGRLRRADDAATLTASALFAGHQLRPLAEVARSDGGEDVAMQARALEDLSARRPFAGLRASLQSAAGETMQLEFSGQPRTDEAGRFAGYWGVARDVSEQLRAETALRRSESMLSTVFATSPDCLSLSEHASGRCLMVNQAFVDTFGYSKEESLGRTLAELNIWTDPADRERLLAALCEHGKVTGMRFTFRVRSGERISMLLSAAVCRVDDMETIVVSARDVTEDDRRQQRAQQELAAARDAAEAASRAKSAFLANTSHEIRTPLNGLLGLARLATGEGLSEAQRKSYVAHIFESAQNLSATLTDILDLSKIEAGKLDIAAAPFVLREALQAVVRAEQNIAQAKSLPLELHVDPALPKLVRGDAMRVRQILGNFVSNAIKFTERGRVRIDAAPLAGSLVRLTVTDSGIGIDAATQQRLFQPFSQADQSTTRRFGGTGLGLSICRELARLMGGGVGMNSAPGEGSVFWADLPLPAASDPLMQDAADAQADDLATLRGARVLVAEDNVVNMMITVAMLEQWGVSVVQATDGAAVVEAVAKAEAGGWPFDAVLMDVQMPRLSGHEAARALRERHGARTPPIVALTAAALVSEREEALNAGMCDFLTKPIDAERMRSVLASWVGRSRA